MPTRKRKSDEMQNDLRATTPSGSPVQKKFRITQAQKQALIDNLQLEITERARHLRAHYALQSSDLRARIERRINRIPVNLRKANMGELYAKHIQAVQSKPASTSATSALEKPKPTSTTKSTTSTFSRPLPHIPQSVLSKPSSPIRPISVQPPTAQGKKRRSEEIDIAADKENDVTDAGPENLPVAKNPKRVKNGTASRQVSRAAKQDTVLSPKSHNSRTLPRSPMKDLGAVVSSPAKPSYIARPTSPLKPPSPLKSAATAASSAISASFHGMVAHAKRGTAATAGKLSRTASKEKKEGLTISSPAKGTMPPPPRPATALQRTASQSSNHSVTSNVSESSTATTLVTKKSGKAAASRTTGTAATAKKAATVAKTALKRNATTANKKVVVAEPAAGRRVLRKRN